MKTCANASKIDLNSICDVCTDVKNTHNRKGTRFQTHHLVCYYHGGGGKVLFIEKEKQHCMRFQNSTIFLGGKFRWHWIQDTHACMMRGRCKVIIVIIWAIVEKKIERGRKKAFFHGNVTELFVSKNACKVCASSIEKPYKNYFQWSIIQTQVGIIIKSARISIVHIFIHLIKIAKQIAPFWKPCHECFLSLLNNRIRVTFNCQKARVF